MLTVYIFIMVQIHDVSVTIQSQCVRPSFGNSETTFPRIASVRANQKHKLPDLAR